MLLNHLKKESFYRIECLLKKIALPNVSAQLLDKEKLWHAMRLDKKSINNIRRFVLLKNIGTPLIKKEEFSFKVPDEIIFSGLDYLLNNFSANN